MFGLEHAKAFRQMVDDMPVNVITCRLSDFEIDYANKATRGMIGDVTTAISAAILAAVEQQNAATREVTQAAGECWAPLRNSPGMRKRSRVRSTGSWSRCGRCDVLATRSEVRDDA